MLLVVASGVLEAQYYASSASECAAYVAEVRARGPRSLGGVDPPPLGIRRASGPFRNTCSTPSCLASLATQRMIYTSIRSDSVEYPFRLHMLKTLATLRKLERL